VATVYLNGEKLLTYGGPPAAEGGGSAAAYTQFEVRLDNASGVRYGAGRPNTLAVYVDGSYGHEHWYAGAGIYRSVRLVRTALAHLSPLALYFPSVVTSHLPDDAPGGAGAATMDAVVKPQVSVINDGVEATSVVVTVRVFEEDSGVQVAAATAAPTAAAGGGVSTAVSVGDLQLQAATLWSVQRPFLYTVQCAVATAAGQVLDAVNTTIGVRSMEWRVDTGAWLNGANVKLRGFCHHDDFTGVGMAVPDRVWLLRAMYNRGLGGNAWRTSHNNYRPAVYDLADALGLLVWDENRDLRSSGLDAMAKMVIEHRNHPSVVVWAFCNEGECDTGYNRTTHQATKNATLYGEFRTQTKLLDPYRPVSGNMWAEWGPGTLTDFLDVQGISHPNAQWIASIRALKVQRPLIASECCSCQSQRGEDVGTVPPNGKPPPNVTNTHFGAFNGDCLQANINLTDSLPYVAGSMIWTLGDYIGEPAPIYWPAVSSSFGAIDLAGFPKAGAWWYQTWWLQTQTSRSAAERPPLPDAAVVHIVEDHQPPPPSAAGPSTLHVYSTGHSVELWVNGDNLGVRTGQEWMGWFEWNTTFAPGNLTAVARDAAGAVTATHTRITAGTPSAIQLSLDAPSPHTATGGAVLLDGHDVALVRATLVDAGGHPSPAAVNVTFEVLGGPGRVLGVGNGDPFCKEPHQARWRTSYHGLARAIVKVTVDAATAATARDLIRQVDVETGKSTVQVADPATPFTAEPIVVRASAPGLAGATLSIPVSVDAAVDDVAAVARASYRMPVTLG